MDRTAPSAVEARDLGLRAAQREAWDLLIERLSGPSAGVAVPRPSPSVLEAMILDIKIVAERNSAVRYLATLDYRFDRDGVLSWLDAAGIERLDSAAPTALLMPVWRDGDRLLVWEPDNVWRRAWERFNLVDRVTPLLLPDRDLTDVATLSAQHIENADRRAMEALAKHYGVAFYYVCVATRDPQSGAIDVLTIGRGPLGEVLRRHRDLASGVDDPEQALAVAARELAERWEGDWRRSVAEDRGQDRKIVLSLRFDGIEQWGRLWRGLKAASGLKGLDIVAFSSNGAEVSAKFQGNLEQLSALLAQNRLDLTATGGRLWLENRL